MFRRLNPLLVRLSRWPRRLAALACLLLAAASALTPATGSGAAARSPDATPVAARLQPGQVAVPVTWDAGVTTDLIRPGARVGIYGGGDEDVGPVLVADHLLVLTIRVTKDLAAEAAMIVVAADRSQAARLASAAGAPTLVVLDAAP